MKHKWSALSLIAVILLLVLSACGGSQNNGDVPQNQANNGNAGGGNAAPDNTGSDDDSSDVPVDTGPFEDLVFSGFTAEKIDPAVAGEEDQEVLTVSEQIYDTVVDLEGGEAAPGLALEWSLSDDELTYEFRLRPNAVFTDGTPITSDVILANFNRWFDPENPLHGEDSSLYTAWLANFDGFRGEVTEDEDPVSKFDGIEKVDNLVFLIHLNVPMENFLEVISGPQFSILNPALMAEEGDLHATMQGSVVGSGPYQVGSWEENTLTLIAKEAYWGAAE